MSHKELHIDDMRGIRNRVAHNYESVSLKILIDTARSDIPNLKEMLANIIKKAAWAAYFYNKKFSMRLQMT